MPHVVADRAALMRATAANLEPLLLTYRSNGQHEPARPPSSNAPSCAPRSWPPPRRTASATACGRSPTPPTWPRSSADLPDRQALIADGHHRWATYLRLRAEHPSPSPWDYGLVLLVDTARYPLRVRAIHRLLHRLPVAEALAALSGLFRVRRLDVPLPEALEALGDAAAEGNAFLLAGDGAFHLVDRPDPDLLARTVPADRPAGLAHPRRDGPARHAPRPRLAHPRGHPGAHRLHPRHEPPPSRQAERDGGTAVLMHPVREEVVRDLARQGVTMPRKSTSFGPKPASGLVLRSLTLD